MKNKIIKISCLVLSTLIFSCNDDSEIDEIKKDVQVLQSDVETLKSDVGVLKSDVQTLKSDVVDIEADISGINSNFSILNDDVEAIKSAIDEIENDIEASNVKIDEIQASTDAKFEEVEANTDAKIEELRAELDQTNTKIETEITNVNAEIEALRDQINLLQQYLDNPSGFAFVDINFDLLRAENFDLEADQLNIQIIWTAAFDLQGEDITYDILINDSVIIENFQFEESNFFGETDINGVSIEDLDDLQITIIAKDGEGNTRNIQKSFPVSSTDIDLGVVESDEFISAINLGGINNEVDNEINFNFEINETYNLQFENQSFNLQYNLFRNVDGERIFINPAFNGDLVSFLINEPGSYTLSIRKFDEFDVDGLGQVELVFAEIESIPFDTTINGNVRYDFSVSDRTNYIFEIIEANYDTFLFLHSADDDSLITSNDDGGVGLLSRIDTILDEGDYYIVIGGFGGQIGQGTMNIEINPLLE